VVDAANPQDLPEVPGRWGNIENWTTVINSITPGTEWVAPATGMISLHPTTGPATAGVQYRTYIAEVVNGTTMPAHIWCSFTYDADGQSFVNVSSGIIQKGHKYLVNSNTGADNVYAAMFTPFITDSTVPVDDPGEVYTTTETKVGTWIDGKPIYRRVLTGTVTTYTDDTVRRTFAVTTSLTFIDKLIDMKGNYTLSDGTNSTVSSVNGIWIGADMMPFAGVRYGKYSGGAHGIWIYSQHTYTSASYELILEYTKQ
jgi:hypothetical protein